MKIKAINGCYKFNYMCVNKIFINFSSIMHDDYCKNFYHFVALLIEFDCMPLKQQKQSTMLLFTV